MAIGPNIRIDVKIKPELAIRRPPRPLIELLDKPEDEFRAYIEELESDPIFKELIQAGAVTKVNLGRRVPSERYEEYMDVQLIQFLRQYRIVDHPDWERDFSDPRAKPRLNELAEKYKAPAQKLNKMIDYFQRVSRDDYGDRYLFGRYTSLEDEQDYIDLIPSGPDLDLEEAIAVTGEFVHRYGLSQEDFTRDFLAEDIDASALARKYGAPLAEVAQVLDALQTAHIRGLFAEGGGTAESAARATSQSAPRGAPVARVFKVEEGHSLALQFAEDGVYAQRYRTNPRALGKLTQLSDSERAHELLLELQWINQRKTVLCRLIVAVCNYQYRYLLTGDLYLLKPLSQADIARQLGEDEATICRLIRDKYIGTPYGTPELKFFFQKKTDVVRRIVQRHSDLTDNQIRSLLEEEYNCKISRRTVAYHRLKAFPSGPPRP